MNIFVEHDCSFTMPNGFRLSASGAYHSDSLIIAYAISDSVGGKFGTIQTWHGDILGTYEIVSKWFGWDRHGQFPMEAVRAKVDGREWFGRYNKTYQLIRLRPLKGESGGQHKGR